MAVSHVYPVIDFTQLDYDKIPIGTFLIGFDSSNGGKLCKMDHVGTITIIESGLLPSLTGLNYQGLWDASINFPTLTSSVGTSGDFYIVSVLGTTNLNGTTDWQVGDWAIFEGGAWTKVDNHDIQTYNTVKDESTVLPQRSTIKFTGAGVTASDVGGETQVSIPIQPAYSTIQEEGASLAQQPIIDFQGTGVTATNGSGKTIVTIPGSVSTTNFGLYTQTSTSTPVTNTVSELSLLDGGLGTLTVPANGFSVGDSFHAVATGHISSINNHKLRIRIKTGSVVLADTGDITLPATTSKHWKLDIEFTVRTIGGSGVASIVSGGSFLYNKDASNALEGITFSTETITGFNTTISNTLSITAQWDTANTGDSIYSEIFTLNKVY